MWRYTLTAIIALGLVAVGILSFVRGQIVAGIAFIAIAIIRLGTVLWGRKPRNPKPSIRLNLDDSPTVPRSHDSSSSSEAQEH